MLTDAFIKTFSLGFKTTLEDIRPLSIDYENGLEGFSNRQTFVNKHSTSIASVYTLIVSVTNLIKHYQT